LLCILQSCGIAGEIKQEHPDNSGSWDFLNIDYPGNPNTDFLHSYRPIME
jgi:hypothetical protein